MSLSSGSIAFSPSSLFPASGAWYDPSDISTLFQDSAGTTPVTASGQPVGKMLDKSGNGNHLVQATAGNRPIYTTGSGLAWLQCDGVTQGLAGTGFTFPATSDFSIALFNAANDTSWVTISNTAAGGGYVGVSVSADGTANSNTSGTPANFVNGVAVSPDTRGGLYTAIGSAAPKVFEAQGATTSTLPWTGLLIGNFTGFAFSGRFLGIIVLPAQSSANRAKVRTYLGAKAGLVL